MTYSQFAQTLLPIASRRRETAPADVAPASVQEREALRRTTADMVRARVGLVMNWKILQLFLAHSQTEISLAGFQRSDWLGYRREALKWGLRSLERRGFLCSRQSPREPRTYWLTEDPGVRDELAVCLTYYGASHTG
jgi:hypothetical protein